MNRLRLLTCTTLLSGVLSVFSVNAQQQISGAQSGTLGPGEYTVTGNVSVGSGATLTIKPGTKFLHTGNFKWNISGKLLAEGAPGDSIYFIRKDAVDKHRMGSINFSNAKASKLDYCVVDYCYIDWSTKTNTASVNVIGGEGLEVLHCRISNGHSKETQGGINAKNTTLLVEQSLITKNSCINKPKGIGIFMDNCTDPKILNSVISFNSSGAY